MALCKPQLRIMEAARWSRAGGASGGRQAPQAVCPPYLPPLEAVTTGGDGMFDSASLMDGRRSTTWQGMARR